MKIRVLSIGRDRRGWATPVIADYAARIERYLPIEILPVGEAQGDDARARTAEASLLRKRFRPREQRVALDEGGESLSSAELANRMRRLERSGGVDLCFFLGGPSGLDRELRSEADWSLSLSPMTFPHQLARVLLLEQIYRAQTILRGEPYSK